ncbi:HAD family hydrolase [Sorangium cellulosum]|uniref:HAD family hydrolase n=1 Tax=Sorangium cellulosum TaxID=56 RepID=UPI003D9AAB9A
MGRPYDDELSELPETYAWAQSVDLRGLAGAVHRAAHLPLVAVGSGGALTAAAGLAVLHRRHARSLGATCTPFQIDSALPQDGRVSVWLMSAGGRNEDIRSAFRSTVSREPKHVAVLCGAPNSPLALDARSKGWVDALTIALPSRDGFLAVSSVLAFLTLTVRAYDNVFGSPELPSGLGDLLDRSFPAGKSLPEHCAELWSRPTTIVLHGASTAVAAADIESRFTEAALGAVQLADFRNFAHGRHHWLAKHGATTAVLALVGPGDERIAARTLGVLPSEIPTRQLLFSGTFSEVLVSSVVTSMHLAGLAGRARAIDPGRPGVPEFGRKLYNMKTSRRTAPGMLASHKEAAIIRKTRCSLAALEARGELEVWQDALSSFERQLSGARFRAIAVDYDGTLREGGDRGAPPNQDVVAMLERLLAHGMTIGIATGRGDSLIDPLRSVLDRRYWDRILIGYHNGGHIRSLAEQPPSSEPPISPELMEAQQVLEADTSAGLAIKLRPHARQLTVMAKVAMSEDDLWHLVSESLRRARIRRVRTVRSSHSVDVLAPGVSKQHLVDELRRRTEAGILCIGDRGRWPGNDYELLSNPCSLSVDEVSNDRSTCWNLAAPGMRGVEALVSYLSALRETEAYEGARYCVI